MLGGVLNTGSLKERRISVDIKDGIKWYTISQEHDIRQWLVDQGMSSVISVLTPMANKTELHSNENLLDEMIQLNLGQG